MIFRNLRSSHGVNVKRLPPQIGFLVELLNSRRLHRVTVPECAEYLVDLLNGEGAADIAAFVVEKVVGFALFEYSHIHGAVFAGETINAVGHISAENMRKRFCALLRRLHSRADALGLLCILGNFLARSKFRYFCAEVVNRDSRPVGNTEIRREGGNLLLACVFHKVIEIGAVCKICAVQSRLCETLGIHSNTTSRVRHSQRSEGRIAGKCRPNGFDKRFLLFFRALLRRSLQEGCVHARADVVCREGEGLTVGVLHAKFAVPLRDGFCVCKNVDRASLDKWHKDRRRICSLDLTEKHLLLDSLHRAARGFQALGKLLVCVFDNLERRVARIVRIFGVGELPRGFHNGFHRAVFDCLATREKVLSGIYTCADRRTAAAHNKT